MFDYSLSKPWHPIQDEWSSKLNHNHRRQRNYIQYPFPIEWINSVDMDNDNHHSITDFSLKRKKICY